jgi:hypothetical protein
MKKLKKILKLNSKKETATKAPTLERAMLPKIEKRSK